jgi:hypothetical protein
MNDCSLLGMSLVFIRKYDGELNALMCQLKILLRVTTGTQALISLYLIYGCQRSEYKPLFILLDHILKPT